MYCIGMEEIRRRFFRAQGFAITGTMALVLIAAAGVLMYRLNPDRHSGAVVVTGLALAAFCVAAFLKKLMHAGDVADTARELLKKKTAALKALPFEQLRVSTSRGADKNFSPPIPFDNINYPPERVQIDGRNFISYVLVENAFAGSGMKQILVHVVWQEKGKWMKVGTTDKAK